MFRESMPKDAGMVFLFDGLEIRPFWMKNCHFPLDMIYATKDGTVVDVLKNVPPCAARSRAVRQRRAEGESRHRPRGERGRRRRERRRAGREAEVGGDSGAVKREEATRQAAAVWYAGRSRGTGSALIRCTSPRTFCARR